MATLLGGGGPEGFDLKVNRTWVHGCWLRPGQIVVEVVEVEAGRFIQRFYRADAV